jgi:hypothetical protein
MGTEGLRELPSALAGLGLVLRERPGDPVGLGRVIKRLNVVLLVVQEESDRARFGGSPGGQADIAQDRVPPGVVEPIRPKLRRDVDAGEELHAALEFEALH